MEKVSQSWSNSKYNKQLKLGWTGAGWSNFLPSGPKKKFQTIHWWVTSQELCPLPPVYDQATKETNKQNNKDLLNNF